MRARIRSFAFGVAIASFAAAAVIACGDDPVSRSYDVADGAPPPANLPEAAPEAAPERDASDERPPFDPKDEAVTCAGAPCATQIVAGSNHFCARLDDGTVRCWGDDSFGALGGGEPNGGPKNKGADAGAPDPDAGIPSSAHEVVGLAGVTQLSAAGSTTCARVDDGGVLCWGGNENGQLGLSAGKASFDLDAHPTAMLAALPGPALRVDVGDNSACAVLASGELWCWGNDEQMQLARGGVDTQPVLVPGVAAVGPLGTRKIALGTTTLLALTAGGDVMSWGALGGKDGIICGRMASISPDPMPYPVAQLHGASSLAVTGSIYRDQGANIAKGIGPVPPPGGGPAPHAHACAVVGGEVSCWGKSDFGALCTGFPDAELVPAHAPIHSAKAWAQQVAVGDEITCARLTDGTIQCCGDDTRGRLGTGKVGLYSAFFAPAEAFKGHAVQVAASNRAVCALVQGGTVECWGGNVHGELALSAPDEAPHTSPSKVAF